MFVVGRYWITFLTYRIWTIHASIWAFFIAWAFLKLLLNLFCNVYRHFIIWYQTVWLLHKVFYVLDIRYVTYQFYIPWVSRHTFDRIQSNCNQHYNWDNRHCNPLHILVSDLHRLKSYLFEFQKTLYLQLSSFKYTIGKAMILPTSTLIYSKLFDQTLKTWSWRILNSS